MSDYSNVYDFTIPANGTIFLEVPGNYYKVLSSTGNLSTKRDSSNAVRPMYAGRGEEGSKFQRLALTDLSGSTNTGFILIASGDAKMIDTTLQLVGAVAVRPEGPSGSYNQSVTPVANTAVQIFTPESNTNGVVLLQAGCNFNNAAGGNAGLIAKASAPATPFDGDPVWPIPYQNVIAGSIQLGGELKITQCIPPGLGLYFIMDQAAGAGPLRARWKTL